MSEPKQTYIVDLATVEMDQKCGMAYWYHKHEGGKGLVLKANVLKSMTLAQTHADIRVIAGMDDISPAAVQACIDDVLSYLTPADKLDVRRMELLYRRLGWFAAYALYIEPKLRELYEDIPIDPECVLDKEPLWVVTYPDRLMRSKINKDTLLYLEYEAMPAGLQTKKWLDSWEYKVRLHAGIAAIEQSMKVSISFAKMVGMSEGFISTTDKRLMHPYVWGYKHGSEWSSTSRFELKDGKKWEMVPVWEFPGGVVQWIQMCGPGTAEAQFRESPYFGMNSTLLDEWVASRLLRERQIKLLGGACVHNVGMRNIHFERRTSQCMPAGEPECSFLNMCWDRETAKRPIMSGLYERNVYSIGGEHLSGSDS